MPAPVPVASLPSRSGARLGGDPSVAVHSAWGAATPASQRQWADSVAAASSADQSDARARAAAVQRLHRLRLDPHAHVRPRVQAFGSHSPRGLESPQRPPSRTLSPAAVSPPGRDVRSRPLSPSGSRGGGGGVGVGVAAARDLVETLQRRVERALAHGQSDADHSDEADSRSHSLRPTALRLQRSVGPHADGEPAGPSFDAHDEHAPLHVQQQYELHQRRLREQQWQRQQQQRALSVPHEWRPETAESTRGSHLLLLVRQLERDLRERLQQLHEEFERVRRQRQRRENLLDQLANVEAALTSYPFPYEIRDQLLALLRDARVATPSSPQDDDAGDPALSPSGGAAATAVAASSADATAAAALSPTRQSIPPSKLQQQQHYFTQAPAAGNNRQRADAHFHGHESHSRVALESHHRAVSHAPQMHRDGCDPTATAAAAHAAQYHQHQHQRGHTAHAISIPSQPTAAIGQGHLRAAAPHARVAPHAAVAPPPFAAFPRAAAVPVASVEHAPSARMRPPAPAAPAAPAVGVSPSAPPPAAAATAAASSALSSPPPSSAAILDLRSAGVPAVAPATTAQPPRAPALPSPPLAAPVGSAAPRARPDPDAASGSVADDVIPAAADADAPALTRSFEVQYASHAASPSPTLPAPQSAAHGGSVLSARPSALSIVRSLAMPAASLLHMPPPTTAMAQRAQ